MNINEQAAKALPKNAPIWAKKNAFATLTTVISTIAGVVAIAAWLGFRPPQVLAADQAYVTHEQFNLLMVNLVESVEEVEGDLTDITAEITKTREKLAQLEMLAEMLMAPAAGGAASAVETPAPVAAPEPVVGPPKPDARVRLNAAKEKIEMLQLEQRTLR